MRNEIAAETKIGFRVTPAERHLIEGKARAVGLSVADYCRRRSMGKRVVKS